MCRFDRILIYWAELPDPAIISQLGIALEGIFGVAALERGEIAISRAFYSEERGQYHAGKVLDGLLALREREKDIVLCITDLDLYVPELNFVFGVASSVQGCALVSTNRLRNSFYGLPDDYEIFLRRLLTEAVHETGHVAGLPHCPNPACVMYFSNSLADTDRKGFEFCPSCRKEVKKVICSED